MADQLISFYQSLKLEAELPEDFRVMNPFQNSPLAMETSAAFYRKFYADSRPRKVLLGINPGRHGGGITGIPFTDSKRLTQDCGLPFQGPTTHEPSSVFIYEMIRAAGGPEVFYSRYLIFPVSPLGFLHEKSTGKWVNANYYDDPRLLAAVTPFIIQSLDALAAMGIDSSVAFCLGLGPNLKFLQKLNTTHPWFDRIVPLEHPRFIIQYRSKVIGEYIQKYLIALNLGK